MSTVSPSSAPNRLSEIIDDMVAEVDARCRGRPGRRLAMPVLVALIRLLQGIAQALDRIAAQIRAGTHSPELLPPAAPTRRRTLRTMKPLPQVLGGAPDARRRTVAPFGGRAEQRQSTPPNLTPRNITPPKSATGPRAGTTRPLCRLPRANQPDVAAALSKITRTGKQRTCVLTVPYS